jgi:hypothetical protein
MRRCRHTGELRYSRHAGEAMVVLHHPVLLTEPGTLTRVAQALAKVSAALQFGPRVEPRSASQGVWNRESSTDQGP